MNHRADYLLQVLEKIGAPLMASIMEANAGGGSGREPAQLHNEAQKIAELLAKTVHASIEMGHSLDLGPMGEMTDSIRIALTGLASPLIAGSFKLNSKAPGDAEIKRMVAALQAVLTFAENFEANTENADRLRNLEARGDKVDAAQEAVQYVQAFLPVVNAAAAFSFGQPEQKLVMEIASRLNVAAKTAQQRLFSDAGPNSKRIELGLLAAMAQLYAACHNAEVSRIQSLDDNQRAQMPPSSFDDVWKNFEVRLAMMEQLAKGIAASGKSAGGGSKQPAPAAVTPPPAPVTPPTPPAAPPAAETPAVFAKPPVQEVPPAPPQQVSPPPPPLPSAPPSAATGTTGSPATPPANPMTFFKAPPKEGAGGG